MSISNSNTVVDVQIYLSFATKIKEKKNIGHITHQIAIFILFQ